MATKSDGKVIISTELDNSQIPKGVKEISGKLGGLKNVVRSLGAAIGVAFSAMAIINFAKESVQAANALSDALTGLRSILDGQGRSFSDAEKFLQEYTADGLIPMTNAITAYKNLASRGYDDSQIMSVMQALKDASAFGRQASYSMGDAVQSATEGLKNENSVLVDNAGVTKNVAKMWEEYAASIGTTANNLTQEQKIQAEVNGILEESRFQAGDAAKVAGTLSGQLSQLSVNFNNLKVAVGNALKPIVQSFLPVINAAVASMTRFANSIASVVGALFGTSTAVQEVASSYESAASNAEDLAEATKEAGKAAKKYLAGFDELNKIGGDSGSGNGSTAAIGGNTTVAVPVVTDAEIQDNISPKIQALVDKIRALIEPLNQIDFAPLVEAFGRLQDAASFIGQEAFSGLEWLWYNILIPFSGWTAEDAVPAFLDLVRNALILLHTAIMAFEPFATWLWENFLKPVTEWSGGIIVDVLGWIADGLKAISDWISKNKPLVEGLITIVASFAAAWVLVNTAVQAWTTICAVASAVTTAFGTAVAFLTSPIGIAIVAIGAIIAIIALLVQNWDTVSQVAADVWEDIVDVWGGVCDWFDETILTPLAEGFKSMVNGVIGFINGMISGVQNGVNALITAINKISFTVPEWIPGIGGSTLGFNLQKVSYPQIPYLAKGAVLPANKPFMAVVGDQKHGTNVEAPLATIQEAVAVVMEDMIQSNIAGHEATVAVLQQILEAVLGIEIDGETISKAVDRYKQKMAVVRGG